MLSLQTVLLLVSTILGTVSLTSCSFANQNSMENQSDAMHTDSPLKRYETADAVADFQSALKAGDLRFLAIRGYTLIVPGVDDYKIKYAHRYSYRIIEGTSDTVTGP